MQATQSSSKRICFLAKIILLIQQIRTLVQDHETIAYVKQNSASQGVHRHKSTSCPIVRYEQTLHETQDIRPDMLTPKLLINPTS